LFHASLLLLLFHWYLQIYLSGDSAGGMMVYVMLCQSQVVPRMVAAAADILGGVGRDYARSRACQNSKAVPFLKIQGMKDPFITYDRDILVDGEWDSGTGVWDSMGQCVAMLVY
jgi:poly(3-hydroxybutyrate) depolymerase